MLIKVHYGYEFRQQMLVDEGKELPSETTIEVNPEDLDIITRQVLVDCNSNINLDTEITADNAPAVLADWAIKTRTAQEERDQQLLADCLETAQKRLDRVNAIIAGDVNPAYNPSRTFCVLDIPRHHGATDAHYVAADEQVGLTHELKEAAGAIAQRQWDENQAAEAARQERAAQAKAAREAERLEWIKEHGSEFLRLAAENGYDCQRRYVTERAAVEHPGFAVNFDGFAHWRERSCPSEAALKQAVTTGSRVVWLTTPPDDCEDPEDEFEPREALVIEGFLGKYDLVKLL